jgi:hypothetical protein
VTWSDVATPAATPSAGGFHDVVPTAAPAPAPATGGWADVPHPGAPPAQKPATNPVAAIGSAISPVAKGKPLDAAVRGAKVEQHKAAIDPLHAVTDVLGGPNRFILGLMGSHGDLGHAWASMTHPSDVRDADDYKAALKVLHIPEPQGQSLAARAGRAVESFGVHMVTDPLNVVPFGGLFKMAAGGVHALEGVQAGIKAVGAAVPVVDKTINAGRTMAQAAHARLAANPLTKFGTEVFGRRPELDPYLSKDMKGVRLGVEYKHRSYEAAANSAAAESLAPLRGTFKNGQIPPEATALYNQQVFRHGTPEMRAAITLPREQGGKFGYVPTDEDLKMFPAPTGALNHNLVEDYQTLINPRKGMTNAEQPIIRDIGGEHKKEFAGFEKSRGDRELHEEDQYDRTMNRIRIGNARVRQVNTDRETEQILNQRVSQERNKILEARGLTEMPKDPAESKEISDLAHKRAGWVSNEPVNVGALSHTPRRAMPDSPLRAVSRLQKAAIKINPFPHGLKNVGGLAFIHGGPEAVGRGWGYTMKGLDDEQRARLVNMGVDADYVRDIEHPLEEGALEGQSALERGIEKATSMGKTWTEGSNKVLTRIELGYRQGLLDMLDRQMPKLADPAANTVLDYKKGEIIRQALGDYRNVSYFVSVLDALGGPFVAFRLGIVPGAVSRALVRRPGYVAATGRGQQIYNEEFQGDKPSVVEGGGPVADAAKMGADPFGYLTGPASLGPIGMAKQMMDPNKPISAGQIAEQGLRQFVPGAGMLEDAGVLKDVLGGGYSTAPGVSPGQSLMMSILGAYYRRRPSERAEKSFESQERRAQ